MIKCNTEVQPLPLIMDGSIIIRSGWNMLVCLDMAKQAVTGNDSTGAFYKNFTYCEHFNCKPTKLLWIQTFVFYSLVNNFKHEYKRELMKRSKKVPVLQI